MEEVMKVPRVSLATLAVVTAVLAVDFALVRWVFDGEPNFAKAVAIGFIPIADALILGLYRILRLRGRRHPFTLGFEVAGWLAVFAFAAACAVVPDSMMGWLVDFAEQAVTKADLAFNGAAQRL